MKTRTMAFLAISALAFFMSFGCGGAAGVGDAGDLLNPSIGIEDPDGGGDDGSGPAGIGIAEPSDTETPALPQKVLIMGFLSDSEGVGIADAEITFHSDPVYAVTDGAGIFEALLEVGEHNFEIASDIYGTMSGNATVTASNLINSAGQAVGQFVATTTSASLMYECTTLRLVDLGKIVLVDPVVGLLHGGSGDDIDAQGLNQTALIVGNSEMTANISVDGRLSGLWFPTVGAFNHIPYLSEVDDWVKPFQGSFAGIKRGDDYYWLTDRSHWTRPVIKYLDGTFAPIAELTYSGTGACSGATIKEKIYVDYDAHIDGTERSNILIRDYTVTISNITNLCKTVSNSGSQPELTMYARFNPNDSYPLFKQWIPSIAEIKCENDRMYWIQHDVQNDLLQNHDLTHSYSIAMQATNRSSNKIPISCIPYLVTQEDARRVVPDAICSPMSVMGSIAEWQIPSTKRIVIATAGCDEAGGPCDAALDDIVGNSLVILQNIENKVKTEWTNWVGTPNVYWAWQDRTKRWLVSMKMLADRNTGAIIAAPSQEPTYYYSWPRDGVYQALSYMMAGKYKEAEAFFKYLFDMFENIDGRPIVESDYGWNQAYSSLDGRRLGLPDYPDRMNIEEDQTPTVLWGLWVYWKKKTYLPPWISNEDVQLVADYVVAQICTGNNLIRPSIDRLENPAEHLGQSLYTNAAAYAGLSGAAEMLGAGHPRYGVYREAAGRILSGIKENLCDANSCSTRIPYSPLLIGDLWLKENACNACLLFEPTDEPEETMMAFAWPFHIFDLDDPRVQSYYDKTWLTHDDFGSFSRHDSLWVPRYLFTYMYAKSAYFNDEVAAAPYKDRLKNNFQEVESNIDDLVTSHGYLMDQYIGGDETKPGSSIFVDYDNETPIHDKLGTAARPLGWSQAMGVLMALAINNEFVPLLEPPPPPAECAFGACCDADGHYRPSTYACGTSTEYACPDGTACGMDVKRRTVTQYCSGSSDQCTGSTSYGSWTLQDNCTASEMCVAGNPVCQPCGTCACTTGACCDGCNFRPSTYSCDDDVNVTYQCEGTGCGDDVEAKYQRRYCSGSAATCTGSLVWDTSWSTHDNCGSIEKCDLASHSCVEKSECKCCTSGVCCNADYTCKSTSTVCNSNVQTVYECAGTGCADDALKKVQKQYCPGNAGTCSGTTSWTTTTHDPCDQYEKCSTTDFQCHENAMCCPPISWSAYLTATDQAGGVKLTWTAAPGATGYVITRMPSGSCPPTPAWDIKTISSGSTITWTDTSLSSGQCATYGIFAKNSCGDPGGCGGVDVGCRL